MDNIVKVITIILWIFRFEKGVGSCKALVTGFAIQPGARLGQIILSAGRTFVGGMSVGEQLNAHQR